MGRTILVLAVTVCLAWLPSATTSAENLTRLDLLSGSTADYSVTTQSVRDVAVLSVVPSTMSVSQGTVVDIEVAVQNLGTTSETFLLNIHDDTDSQSITNVSLVLAPGQVLTLGLPWDTSHASSGSHLLTVSANLSGDQVPANNSLTILSPIEVVPSSIVLGDGTGLELPDASFSGGMAVPGMVTQGLPSSSTFVSVPGVTFGNLLNRAGVNTTKNPRQGFYIANADATFAASSTLSNPFLRGEIHGVVHLQGLASSTGAYIEAGTERQFADSTGGFRFPVPSGSYDLVINAPGYVPVRIPNATVNSGDLITIPELTLPFGDSNGDGKIDILDLSIAAANFGSMVQEIPPP